MRKGSVAITASFVLKIQALCGIHTQPSNLDCSDLSILKTWAAPENCLSSFQED